MKKNKIVVTSLCAFMAFGILGTTTKVFAQEQVQEASNTDSKVGIDEITYQYSNPNNGRLMQEKEISKGNNVDVDVIGKSGNQDGITGEYHFKWENLTPEIIDIKVTSSADIRDPELIIESKDSGAMKFIDITIVPKTIGDAKIKCTYYDIDNPTITKTEMIEFVVNEKNEDLVEEVTFEGASDPLASKEALSKVSLMMGEAVDSATISLTLTEKLDTITLPEYLLKIAKEKQYPLNVIVDNNGLKTTWSFTKVDNTMDVNLAMDILNTKDFDALRDEDGLVFSFKHAGLLPTGTTVKTYVGDKFKTGDKVQVSYFDEASNALKETKEYKVDENGDITVVINHCSNYLVKAVKAETPTTPVTPETPKAPVIEGTASVTKPTTATGPNKDAIKATGNSQTGAMIMLLGLVSICGISAVLMKKYKA